MDDRQSHPLMSRPCPAWCARPRGAFLAALALMLPDASHAARPASAAKTTAAKQAPGRIIGKPSATRARSAPLGANTPPTAAIDQLVARKWREAKVTPAKLSDD